VKAVSEKELVLLRVEMLRCDWE